MASIRAMQRIFMKQQLSVYYYTSPNQFLCDFWSEKKSVNSSFTIRAWAKQMGLKSHNSLYEVVKGKRAVPKSYIPKIKEATGFNEREVNYFEALIDYKKAKDIEEKDFYAEKIQKLKGGRSIDFVEVQTFKILKDPLCGVILEMSTNESFKADVDWIYSRLKIKKNKSQIKQSLDLLISGDYIVATTKSNKFIKANKNITSSEDIEDTALKEFHKELSNISKDQIEKQSVSERDFRGTILNIEVQKIPEAKKRLQEFMRDFINEFESKKQNKVKSYCLHTKLFALTEEI